MHIDEDRVMVVFRSKYASGSIGYTERDGDVSYNETPEGWEMRSSNFPGETKTFKTYQELEEFMLEYLELDGIVVFK